MNLIFNEYSKTIYLQHYLLDEKINNFINIYSKF